MRGQPSGSPSGLAKEPSGGPLAKRMEDEGVSRSWGSAALGRGESSGPLAACGCSLGSVTSGDTRQGSGLAAPSEAELEPPCQMLSTMKTCNVSSVLMDGKERVKHRQNQPAPSPTRGCNTPPHAAHPPHEESPLPIPQRP